MQGQLLKLPEGTNGFDCNATVGLEDARAFYERGYRFAMRYIRRQQPHDHDLSRDEVQALLDAGLAAMAVQHVESERSWYPTAVKGSAYGNVAAEECLRLGLPPGLTVWCDLEGTAVDVRAADVIAYCREWFQAVRSAGYLPGLYVGWNCGLTPEALYQQLAFQHYWAAFNLNADQFPAVRGVQMRQHAAKPEDAPAGLLYAIDTDTVQHDRLGGLPTAWAPNGWAP